MIRIIFVVFVLSGFVGLMYEAIWSRYLKLLLGHSSAGQILTLAIFMGGLGLGSYIIGKFISKVRRPLFVYALVEAAVGILGWLYHPIYTAVTGAYFNWVTGAELPYAMQVTAKLVICLVTTLPVAILLGMTFPLIAVGVMRQMGDRGARSLSLLYFTNSLGAAAGILVTSYLLIRNFGTPGTLMIAGTGNLLIALVMILISKRQEGDTGVSQVVTDQAHESSSHKHEDDTALLNVPTLSAADVRVWLGIAALTGFASFIYEVGWIRLVSLLMGSSTHSFDIMVSAFVLGLAFGGLYSRRLLRSPGSLAVKLGIVQVLMGVFALATIFVHHPVSFFFNELHLVLGKSESAFVAYSAIKYLVCLSFMFPASFCAGITLPIITYALVNGRKTEKYTGYVYAFNTTGSIIGASIAGYFMLPLLQLKWTIAAGALLDASLGVYLLWRFCPNKLVRNGSIIGLAAITLLAAAYKMDLFVLNLGTYRSRIPNLSSKTIEKFRERYDVFVSRDGRTATISLSKSKYETSIRTNGKSDGSSATPLARSQGQKGDNATMAGLAYLPMRMRSEPYDIAVIGMGTGLTAHYFLADPLLKHMDLIEIEKEVINLAEYFRPENERVFTDKRINFVLDDAKSYFYNSDRKYDLIVSEPSNPWVSGVSSLFTQEFYHHVKQFIRPGGALVQWLHVYEFNDELLFSILKALGDEFPDYLIYQIPENNDIVVIASQDELRPDMLDRVFTEPGIVGDHELQGWPVTEFNPASLIATSRTLGPIVRDSQANSDYYPIVDENAEMAFFRHTLANYVHSRLREFPALERELDPRMLTENMGPEAIAKETAKAEFDPKEEAVIKAYMPHLGEPGMTDRFEFAFYPKLRPIVGLDAWMTHPIVAEYRRLVDAPGGKLEPLARLRFKMVDAYSRRDKAALAEILPQMIKEQRAGMVFWDRAMLVSAYRLGDPGILKQVVAKYWSETNRRTKEDNIVMQELVVQVMMQE